MNKRNSRQSGKTEDTLTYAVAFSIFFIIGGTIGTLSFPPFPGRFFITGIVFSALATRSASIIVRSILLIPLRITKK